MTSSGAPYRRTSVLLGVAALCFVWAAGPHLSGRQAAPSLDLFVATASQDRKTAEAALEELGREWRDGYAMILWDIARFMRAPARRQLALPPGSNQRTEPTDGFPAPESAPTGGGSGTFIVPAREHPTVAVRRRLISFLEQQTGKRFGQNLDDWHRWMWTLPYEPHPDYAEFKGYWYAQVDRRLSDFFPPGVTSAIRLDEIDWGGVAVNGIPPLEYSPTVQASAAGYLKDNHVVFGIAVDGEARAYPKRILAWHEMALDRLGDVELSIVYCTLCGTVIPFESVIEGRHITFGTSGLLYRSNKLMFDLETQSLWSTFEGAPVVGELVDSGLRLKSRAVVTTTWGEWRAQHPETTVLSIETGYARDYSEGAAYRSYFSNERLMFPVPGEDDRLKNKDEVLVLTMTDQVSGAAQPVAIAAKMLSKRRVFHAEVGSTRLVVLTSPKGANRVFDAGEDRFVRAVDLDRVVDASGRSWRITEQHLVLEQNPTERRPRVPAQRAFWFGWRAQFPDTLLLK